MAKVKEVMHQKEEVKSVKVVFISAPYSSVTPAVREDVTRVAEATAILLWENGVAAICPHLNSGHFSDHKERETVVYRDGYVEVARRCDALFCLFPSTGAPGVMDETEVFLNQGKPTFIDIKQCLLWAKKGEK